jgi:hypothetical protein
VSGGGEVVIGEGRVGGVEGGGKVVAVAGVEDVSCRGWGPVVRIVVRIGGGSRRDGGVE